MKWKEYIKDVISPSDTTSSRKFVTLLIAAHFILASFVVLFFAFYVILWAPKGKVDVDLLSTLKIVLQYDFYIILSGLGFITSSDVVKMIVSKGFDPSKPFPTNADYSSTNADIPIENIDTSTEQSNKID